MSGSEQSTLVGGVSIGPDNVELLEAGLLGDSGGGMLVEGSEVTSEVKLVLDGKVVLVTEDDDSAVGN